MPRLAPIAALLALALVLSACGEREEAAIEPADASTQFEIRGEWRGPLTQEGEKPFSVRAAIVSLERFKANEVSYTGIDCSGTWEYLGASETAYRFQTDEVGVVRTHEVAALDLLRQQPRDQVQEGPSVATARDHEPERRRPARDRQDLPARRRRQASPRGGLGDGQRAPAVLVVGRVTRAAHPRARRARAAAPARWRPPPAARPDRHRARPVRALRDQRMGARRTGSD